MLIPSFQCCACCFEIFVYPTCKFSGVCGKFVYLDWFMIDMKLFRGTIHCQWICLLLLVKIDFVLFSKGNLFGYPSKTLSWNPCFWYMCLWWCKCLLIQFHSTQLNTKVTPLQFVISWHGQLFIFINLLEIIILSNILMIQNLHLLELSLLGHWLPY